MSLFNTAQRNFAEKAIDLVVTNPFCPDWMEKQREVLGARASDPGEVYAWQPGWGLWGPRTVYPDVVDLGRQIADLADAGNAALRQGAAADAEELRLYHTLALYRMYRTFGEELDRFIDSGAQAPGARQQLGNSEAGTDLRATWTRFLAESDRLLALPGVRWPIALPPEHLFACYFTLRRAFYHIFFNLVGTSAAVARLRGAVWESIVTWNLHGWSQGQFARMKDTPTLITGPSGTGKELVAQAIGRSLYIPFDRKKQTFAVDFLTTFRPVNLSALSPQLIESELFGHVKGAFTGAVGPRTGRLEECPEQGAVFLDEIGELTGELQVKLLRVLQDRRFQPVGSGKDVAFEGKVIAATNRDLSCEIESRRFREDLYYRLCADRVVTPPLREQLADRPEDLPLLVTFICHRVVGPERAEAFCSEVVAWIEGRLGRAYPWPGNFRELEQCVRSYAIRKEYHPLRRSDPTEAACAALADEVVAGRRSYNEAEQRVFTLVYRQAGTWQEAGRLLGRDWRTVKRIVEGEAAGHDKTPKGRAR
ncbi:MAG: sigma 54-interacting transcriptional regulator [Gemmataceae bacterium]